MSHYDPNKHDQSENSRAASETRALSATSVASGKAAVPFTGGSTLQGDIRTQCQSEHDREVPEVDLMSPLTIRGVTFRNRVVMSPMCMYSAQDGFANEFHFVHLRSRAMGGVGLVFVEATAVTAEGRISPGDMGIWKDEHIHPLARIAQFVETQGAVPAIQLAHAGRKASCDTPWTGGRSLKTAAEGGWPVVGPSALPSDMGDPVPAAMSQPDIEHCIDAWEAATRRALAAGFKVIELHAAHGYLLHEFLSPISHRRTGDSGANPA